MVRKNWIIIASSLAIVMGAIGTRVAIAQDGPCANQGHMQKALEFLNGAAMELHEAARNKGGERGAALRSIEDAKRDVFEGCKIANGR